MPAKLLSSLWQRIRPAKAEDLFQLRLASKGPVVRPGLYHAMREFDGRAVRFHLRVEPDGRGLLIVGASAMIRLSESGSLIAKGLIEGVAVEPLIAQVRVAFPTAATEQIRQDVERVRTLVEDLCAPRADWPVYNLDDPALSAHACRLMAPVQADVTLAEPERLRPIFARLWEVGIAHVHLRGGLTPDARWLVRGVEHAEDLGMIAGARVPAGVLAGGTLLEDLAQSGVDYLSLPYAFLSAADHDRHFGRGDFEAFDEIIGRVLRAEVGAVAEVPLINSTIDHLSELLEKLRELEIQNAVVYAVAVPSAGAPGDALSADALPQVGNLVEEAASEAQVRFVWVAPVVCEKGRTIESILADGPRGTAEVSIRVEPDGSVVPVRGPRRPAGNLLRDSWEQIWASDVFRRYRERVEAPTRCEACPGLAVCAMDCPREPAGWSWG
jgi:radical SAM protein with 4Fe4S-binding SPASM domain